jgi:cell division protein FtsA
VEITSINQKDIIFALDIGTRSIIGTVGMVRDKKFYVVEENSIEHEQRAMIDGQIHDISLVASSVNIVKKSLEEKLNTKLDKVAIAAAGRFLRTVTSKAEFKLDNDKEVDKDTLRSLELTAVKSAEKEINEQTEGKLYCVGYSVKNYYLNGYVISNLLSHKGERVEAEIIATFLPRSVVDSLYSVMDRVGLQVSSLTLEPIAAIEAAIPQNFRLLNLALVDIGAGTSDIAISSKDSISAYGMVPLAGDEITEAIAQNYLIDFNTAERVKKECSIIEKVKYIDILGLENEVPSKEVIKLITPIVKKISEELGNKIIELNGGKYPNAVFLVGGGAHTPLIKELLAEKLNISLQRIGIRERDTVTDCVCQNNSLGSIGVTVLGIALIAIKRSGHDFINVTLNGNVVSLFNSHKHTIMDVMMQAGIDPKLLMGKNGKSIRFMLNGIKRVAFGTLAVNSEILLKGNKVSIDEGVKEGDIIEVNYAKDGSDAHPAIKDYVKRIYSVTFFVNDIIENLEPVAIINGKQIGLEGRIKEGDEVQLIFPETLGQYVKYFEGGTKEYKYYLNGKELEENYAIKDGDRIYRLKQEKIKVEEKAVETNKCTLTTQVNAIDKHNIANNNYIVNRSDTIEHNEKNEHNSGNNQDKIQVTANGNIIILSGKKNHIFVDIFNHIEFDLSSPKGNIYLRLNGKKAGYYDKISNGDVIEIGWE